jgi:VanZ family protein
MALIFGLSSQSTLPRVVDPVPDKVAHAAAYAALGVLCLRACHGGLQRLRPGATLLALGLTLGYGALDEWHQSFVPRRRASAGDWLADAAGAALALPLTGLLAALRERTSAAAARGGRA